jgi:curli biogenesis system outer membrane secretion channel CsgG
MTRLMKMIASVAFAAALAPVAANAATTTLQDRVQSMMNSAVSEPLPVVQRIAVDFNASQAQMPLNQTIVQSGAIAQLFPGSVGG